MAPAWLERLVWEYKEVAGSNPVTPDSYKYARVAQLVERDLAKVEAAGSSPVSRSFLFLGFMRVPRFRSPLLIYIELLKVFTEGFVLSFRICLLEEIQETKKNEGKCVIF